MERRRYGKGFPVHFSIQTTPQTVRFVATETGLSNHTRPCRFQIAMPDLQLPTIPAATAPAYISSNLLKLRVIGLILQTAKSAVLTLSW